MKDIVANRSRISLTDKWRAGLLALRENGLVWCACLGTYYVASAIANRAFSAMDRLRRERNLPGLNSATLNKHIWQSWDWSAQGDEWSQSKEWEESLVRSVLHRYIPNRGRVLEIGPGGGRWTAHLLERAEDYVGVDISATCVAHCQKRFAAASGARFLVGSGRDLTGVDSASIDSIWSFDAFVHINAREVDGYITEFARVLRPGGTAVIHHGAVGGSLGGWRSNLTANSLHEMVRRSGLRIEQVLTSWAGAAGTQNMTHGDQITVMSKPADVQSGA